MASVQQSPSGSRMPIVGINVTPMVDVVLVLLVIMMVSAIYIVSQSIQVELPRAVNSDDSVTSIAAVTLTKDRQLYYNGERITEAQLEGKLSSAYGANHDVNLVVSADEDARHGAVVHVIDLAKAVGISKFAINVERTK